MPLTLRQTRLNSNQPRRCQCREPGRFVGLRMETRGDGLSGLGVLSAAQAAQARAQAAAWATANPGATLADAQRRLMQARAANEAAGPHPEGIATRQEMDLAFWEEAARIVAARTPAQVAGPAPTQIVPPPPLSTYTPTPTGPQPTAVPIPTPNPVTPSSAPAAGGAGTLFVPTYIEPAESSAGPYGQTPTYAYGQAPLPAAAGAFTNIQPATAASAPSSGSGALLLLAGAAGIIALARRRK